MSAPDPAPAPALDRTIQSQLMTSDGWVYRRMLVFSVTWFLCGVVGFLAWSNTGSPLATMLVPYLFTGIMTFGLAYVFGACWDDRNKRALAERLGASQDAPGASSDP